MTRRPRIIAGAAALALVVTGGSIAVLSAPGPACATPGQVLAVVPGGTFSADGPLPARATAAIRSIKRQAGFEGVWVHRDGSVHVGVYGPTWARARAAATAVARTPGPSITYVCEPTTEHRLLAIQDALVHSEPGRRDLLGSGIDVETATVTLALKETAPRTTESELARRFGSRVSVERLRGPYVEMGPGTGRMPLARDDPQEAGCLTTAVARAAVHPA